MDTFNPRTKEAENGRVLCELEANLRYIENSSQVRITQRDPVSKQNKTDSLDDTKK